MTLSHGIGLRFVIIALAVLLALQLLILGGGSIGRARDLGRPVQPLIIDQIAAAADLLDGLPAEARRDAVRALDSPFIRMRLLDRFPVSQSADPPLAAFRPILSAYRGALPDRELRIYRQRVGPVRARIAAARGRTPRADELLVVVRLADGSALAVEPSRIYRRHVAVGGLALISTVVGGVLLAALVWASLATTRPLRSMARTADSFADDLDAPAMAETGPGAVRELAKAFNRMQARLRALVSERMSTLAAVSHDMRTYLTRLRMRAEFIDDEQQRDKAVRDLDDMTELLDDTLTLARTLDAADHASGETCDILDIVRKVAAARSELGEPVFLDVSRFAGPLEVRGSRSALTRAVSNVIDNAVRYGCAAHVRVNETEGMAAVIVHDDGPGVPDAELAKLGTPFHRVEVSRSRETGGSGLGLAIARAAVERAGGGLAFENTPRGLEARLKLARVTGARAAEPSPPSGQAAETGSETPARRG